VRDLDIYSTLQRQCDEDRVQDLLAPDGHEDVRDLRNVEKIQFSPSFCF
jgi:hypothetical protein